MREDSAPALPTSPSDSIRDASSGVGLGLPGTSMLSCCGFVGQPTLRGAARCEGNRYCTSLFHAFLCVIILCLCSRIPHLVIRRLRSLLLFRLCASRRVVYSRRALLILSIITLFRQALRASRERGRPGIAIQFLQLIRGPSTNFSLHRPGECKWPPSPARYCFAR